MSSIQTLQVTGNLSLHKRGFSYFGTGILIGSLGDFMCMDTERALTFLRSHQPMPSDHVITDDEGAMFAAIVQHFETKHDGRCIPLLIHSVSPETGLGMYEHIKFVLMAYTHEQVIPHLRHGLRLAMKAFDIAVVVGLRTSMLRS